MTAQTATEIGGALPPVAVGSLVLFGIPLQEWVLLLTAVYTIIMIIRTGPAALAVVADVWRPVWRKVRRQKKP